MTPEALATTSAAAAAWEFKDIAALISAITAIVAVVVGYLATRRTLEVAKSNAEAVAWQKANEAELAAIKERLDKFFGPFRQMSGINMLMNRDLRARQLDDRFLLIEKLFDRSWLASRPDGEKALISEIAANARWLRAFIADNAGMVDERVQPYLSRVSAHYRMIELAYEGKLGDDPAPFVERYVFPRQIDDVLRLEVERLERRRQLLVTKPFCAPLPPEPLQIPDELALKEWPNPKRAHRPELNMEVE